MNVERTGRASGKGRRAGAMAVGLLCVAVGALTLVSACSVRSSEPPSTLAASDTVKPKTEYRRLRAAVRREPENAEAWRALGDHCYFYRQGEGAVAAWRASLRLEPRQAELRWKIGTVYAGEGDDEAAQREYWRWTSSPARPPPAPERRRRRRPGRCRSPSHRA